MSDNGDDWIFDPSLAAMYRQLRRELREEARATELSQETSELRGRLFSDVALELRNRGDVVLVATQRRSFEGLVRFVGRDFLTITAPHIEVDINLAAIDYLKATAPGARGGAPVEPSAGSFELRLLEKESPIEKVEVGFSNREEILLGQVSTVGQDHIVLLDDQRSPWVLPTSSIAFVVRRPKKDRR